MRKVFCFIQITTSTQLVIRYISFKSIVIAFPTLAEHTNFVIISHTLIRLGNLSDISHHTSSSLNLDCSSLFLPYCG